MDWIGWMKVATTALTGLAILCAIIIRIADWHAKPPKGTHKKNGATPREGDIE